MLIRYSLLWLPMILIAFANAAVREMIFIKYFNELSAHQLSTLSLILMCSIYLWCIFPQLKIISSGEAIFVGGVWMLLTVIFEFALGRLTGKSWSFLLRDYDLMNGHIWPLFLLSLFLLPFLFFVARTK